MAALNVFETIVSMLVEAAASKNGLKSKVFVMRRYNKVAQIGDPTLEGLLDGNVIVEEKIDGSQFRIEVLTDGTMNFGSKGVDFIEKPVEKMFKPIVDTCTECLEEWFKKAKPRSDLHMFGEFVSKPKHNTLKYERVPKNNFIVFDIYCDGWLNYAQKKQWAHAMGFETVSTIWVGDGKLLDKDKINELLQVDSALGNEKVEGIVIKNYNKYYDIVKFPFLTGQHMVGKYVSEKFKELNKANWKNIKKGPVEVLVETLKSEPRWQKAYQHLRDEGQLSNSVRDIPLVIKEVIRDVEEEEKESIKQALWDHYWRPIRTGMIKGLPEWYKQKLLENVDVKNKEE